MWDLLLMVLLLTSISKSEKKYIMRNGVNKLYNCPCGCVLIFPDSKTSTVLQEDRNCQLKSKTTLENFSFECACGCEGDFPDRESLESKGHVKFYLPTTIYCSQSKYGKLENNYILCGCVCGGPYKSYKNSTVTFYKNPKCPLTYQKHHTSETTTEMSTITDVSDTTTES